MWRDLKGALAVSGCLLSLAGMQRGAAAQLRGAGATFPAPIYTKWFAAYKSAVGISIDYQAVGSGAGYTAIKNKTVDFGASDAPLTPAEEAAMSGPAVHIPTVGGAVALTYNLPGVGSGIRFTPEIISGIYLGVIKNWNDPKIKAANPWRTLPDLGIQPVHRTDGSGTTYIFTNYLKKADSAWAQGPGAGKSISWPVGTGGKGNPGVATVVKNTPGAIGYVELAYAVQNNLPYGSVRNRAGNFVAPGVATTTAAINEYVSDLKSNVKTPTVDAKGINSYPICSLTYIILYKTGGQSTAAAKLWSWAMEPAQQNLAASLYYAPLPTGLVSLNLATLQSIH